MTTIRMRMASSEVIENLPENGTVKAAEQDDGIVKPIEQDGLVKPVEQTAEDTVKWRKAKKHAVMVSFVGKNYLGMQRNPGYPTIEEELLKAFKEAGTICDEWFETPQKGHFQRASRTDKGVSAARMVISLKFLTLDEDREETIRRINAKLPTCIRVQTIKKVTKNFNAKSAADNRTYIYFLPTYAFAPIIPSASVSENNETQEESQEDFKTTLAFRMNEKTRQRVNDTLKEFIGTKYYHNYTSGKLPLEPSSQRYITHFECSEPFVKDDMEFAIIKIKGQSFMLHQIRKMIGMTIAVVRGHASLEVIHQSWDALRIDIPRAPGLGLMLDEIHFDRYNKRFANDGIHEGLTCSDAMNEDIESFKDEFIFPEMIQGEKEYSMFEWLKVLPQHSFTQRHFENTEVDNSPLRKAALLAGKLDLEKSRNENEDEIKE